MRKIPTRLRDTNFCTSSARFAWSSVRQPNGPKYTQISRNTPKCQIRVQWGRSLRKIPMRLRGTNFCTSSAGFPPSFVVQPNGPECTQMVRNDQNVRLGSNGVDRMRSLRKIPTRLRGANFCTSSSRFAPSFVRQPNGPKCTQAKNSNATSWLELLP